MTITTKTGDQGETGRFGGARISKDDIIICALGTIDELNSAIGLLVARQDLPIDAESDLKTIQATCFTIGAQLSTPKNVSKEAQDYIPRLSDDDVRFLERKIDEIEHCLGPQRKFILPGGSSAGAMCFWIRTIARRAERIAVKASYNEPVDEQILVYLNRLSDYFYVLARFLNQESGIEEVEWSGGH
ncbi:cob(I)yrinic acid a,c-diamide adenosyltransferase [Patescibacteria group bacterium]|nr:cob(I)yrinic acid a,c-diamide adenosyltransferase [Patescibacteria group bacterium]